MSGTATKRNAKEIATPRPSSSVLVISPTNQILLLHRVQTSSAFPAAHVFPGGNLDSFHDGDIPPVEDARRHEDGPAYRLAAIRETFEESGILLARNNGFGRLIEVSDEDREDGRHKIHKAEVPFEKWLAGKGGRADVDGLIPFTRWITPTHIPRRYTTQMYMYFLPLASSPTQSSKPSTADEEEAMIPIPTSDGGLEHTAASFKPPSTWIEMQNRGDIIVFPPQMFLLSLISPFLSPSGANASDVTLEELRSQRQRLRDFLKTGDPPWGEVCIGPQQFMRLKDGRTVLSFEKPGHELEGTNRRGEKERVAIVEFKKEGPRNVEIAWKKDVVEAERGHAGEAKL
ncbi:MAG: hypothetical protein M1828_003706 [Chrysothrix sp. TS-e1954]|nr:MAG: hypothetical protein M1828_003706 [Chrysothrix sp. TS-e1954]